MLMAMSPLVAHAYGAGQYERVGGLARQALWLSQLIALAMIVPMLLNLLAYWVVGLKTRSP